MLTVITINRIVRFRQCVFQTPKTGVQFGFILKVIPGNVLCYAVFVHTSVVWAGGAGSLPLIETEEKRSTRVLLGFCFFFQLELSPHLVLIKTVYIFSVGGSWGEWAAGEIERDFSEKKVAPGANTAESYCRRQSVLLLADHPRELWRKS